MTAPVTTYSVLSHNPDLKVWTGSGVTSTSGALTVAIPAGALTSVLGVQVTCVRNSPTASGACFALVRSYSSPTANAAGNVVVQVFESKTTNIGMGGTVEGLEATNTATTVLLTVFGS